MAPRARGRNVLRALGVCLTVDEQRRNCHSRRCWQGGGSRGDEFARWRQGAGEGVGTVEARPGERWAPLAVVMQRMNKGRTKANLPCYRSRMRWQWGRWCIAYLTAPEACSVYFFRRERCGRRRARGAPRRRQEGERAGRVVC